MTTKKPRTILIIYNPGGLGRAELEEDMGGWPSLISGIKREFEKGGFRIKFYTHQRAFNFVHGTLQMVRKFKIGAKKEAQFLKALLEGEKAGQDYKVLLVGGCYGGFYSLRVAEFTGNKRIFYIATGIPFWLKHKSVKNGLIINNNGIADDPMVVGDWKNIFKIYLKIPHPGHGYFWHDRPVRTKIKSFLAKIIKDDG